MVLFVDAGYLWIHVKTNKKAFLLYSKIVSICRCDGGACDTFIIYLSVVSSLCQVILLCTLQENVCVYWRLRMRFLHKIKLFRCRWEKKTKFNFFSRRPDEISCVRNVIEHKIIYNINTLEPSAVNFLYFVGIWRTSTRVWSSKVDDTLITLMWQII